MKSIVGPRACPASGVRNFPGVVFLKYGGGIFENIPEKCGIFVIYRKGYVDEADRT